MSGKSRKPDRTGYNYGAISSLVLTADRSPIAVSTAYAAVEYCPQNIFHALQQINQRLENIENSLQNIDNQMIGLAQTANLRIVSRNTRLQVDDEANPPADEHAPMEESL